MTPEQEELQAKLKQLHDLENYNAARDSILAYLATAYAANRAAAAEFAVVENRVASGDWSTPEMQAHHNTMKIAMAGQHAIIQQAAADYIAALEAAQAIVHEATAGTFIKGVPLPAPPEPEPVE